LQPIIQGQQRGGALARDWPPQGFAVHRAENTDDPDRLRQIVEALDRIAATVWPVHPRTRKRIGEMGWAASVVTTIDPLSYLDMLLLEGHARFILTDSGGVQKEAYFFCVPCITLRDETEWQETLENQCNVLTGCSQQPILEAASAVSKTGPWSKSYGDGRAADKILDALA
jgi:UDP-N-acetylglucosamine 2-epimerase